MSAACPILAGAAQRLNALLFLLYARAEAIWQGILFACRFISVILIPINIGIIQYISMHPVTLVLMICEVFFLIEFIMQHINQVNKFYISNILSFLPLILVPIVTSVVNSKASAWALLPGMFCITQLNPALKFFCVHYEQNFTMLSTFLFMFIYLSALASIWFCISCNVCISSGHSVCQDQSMDTWIANDTVLDQTKIFSRYIRSLHFIVQTVFTVGFGDIHPYNNDEIMFTLFLLFNGSIFFAFLISSIMSLLSNRDINSKKYREDLAIVKQFMAMKSLADCSLNSVNQYFDFIYSKQFGVSESKLLSELPRKIASDMREQCSEQLKSIPFFGCQSTEFLRLCTSKLQFRTYIPNAVIVHNGDYADELLLVRSGRIEICINENSKSSMTLVAGDYLGDYNLICRKASEFHAFAAVFSETLVLDYQSFVEVLQIITQNDSYLASDQCAQYQPCKTIAVELNMYPPSKCNYQELLQQIEMRWIHVQTHAMQLTFDAYRDLLLKISKAQSTIDASVKSKRLQAMMEVIAPSHEKSMVIMPNNSFRLYWDALQGFICIYYCTVIPMRIMILSTCGRSRKEVSSYCLSYWNNSLFIDYMIDVIRVIDIILRYKYFAFAKFDGDREIIVTDSDEIKSEFHRNIHSYLSIFMALPFDLLMIHSDMLVLFRLPKILNIIMLPSIIRSCSNFGVKEWKWIITNENISMLVLVCIVLAFLIWTSTAWALFHFDGSGHVSSYYWTMITLSTVGFGDITPNTTTETLYTITVTITGPCLFAIIIANVASYVQRNSNLSFINTFRSEVCHHFLQYVNEIDCDLLDTGIDQVDTVRSKAPMDGNNSITSGKGSVTNMSNILFNRSKYYKSVLDKQRHNLVEYLNYIDKERIGFAENSYLNEYIPTYIGNILKEFDVRNSCKDLLWFKKFDKHVASKIINLMEEQIYCKKGYIFEIQPPVKGMYIIKKGSVSLIDKKDRSLETKCVGDIILEQALYGDYNASSNPFKARASTNCEVWYLSANKFHQVLSNFPEIREQYLSNSIDTKLPAPLLQSSCRGYVSSKSIAMISMANIHQTTSNRWKNSRLNWVRRYQEQIQLICKTFLVIFTIYNAIVIPYRIAFAHNTSIDYTFVVDYIGDTLFFIDLIFRYSMHIKCDCGDQIGIAFQNINTHLFKTDLFYHTLAFLPFDLLVLAPSLTSTKLVQTQVIAYLRVNKFFRFVNFNMNLVDVEVFIKSKLFYIATKVNASIRIEVINNFWEIFSMVFSICTVAHICGCIFFSIASFNHNTGDTFNWADAIDLYATSVNHQYTVSLYFAITVLNTVGYGDIVPESNREKIFTCFLIVVGSGIFALIMVRLQNIVANLDVSTQIFNLRVECVQTFLLKENVPEQLRNKSNNYHVKLWTCNRGVSGADLKVFLPSKIYNHVMKQFLLSKLNTLYFVNELSNEFQDEFVGLFTIQEYIKGDYIFIEGEISTDLHFVKKGLVELVEVEDKLTYGHISAGLYLGESEFLMRSYYACSARVKEDATILQLEFNSFWKLLQKYGFDDRFVTAVVNLFSAERNGINLLKSRSTLELVQNVRVNLQKSFKISKLYLGNTESHKKGYIIYPGSVLAGLRTGVSLFFTIFMALTVPYILSFHNTHYWSIMIIDIVAACFACIDIYIQLRLLAVQINDRIIENVTEISEIYYDGEFWYDLISAIPPSLIIYAFTNSFEAYSFSRAINLVWLRRIRIDSKLFIDILGKKTGISFSSALISICSILLGIVYLCHVITCIFCLIGITEVQYDEVSWIDNFIDQPQTTIYFKGAIWAAYTLTTVGYGFIELVSDNEKIFAIVVMIVGNIICNACVPAVLGFIIDHEYKSYSNSKRFLEASKLFCDSNNISLSTKNNIVEYFHYLGDGLSNVNEEQAYGYLPSTLQFEFNYMFAKVALESIRFNQYEMTHSSLNGMVVSIIRAMKPYIATPDEKIVALGTGRFDENKRFILISSDLHVLRRGIVQVLDTRNFNSDYINPGAAVIPAESPSSVTHAELSSARVLCISISAIELCSEYAVDALKIIADCADVMRPSLLSRKDGCLHTWHESLILTIPADALAVTLSIHGITGDKETQLSVVTLSILNLPIGSESDFDDSLVITCDIAADNNWATGTCTTANSIDHDRPTCKVLATPFSKDVVCDVSEKYTTSQVVDFESETTISNEIDNTAGCNEIPLTAIVPDQNGRMKMKIENDGSIVGTMTLQMLVYLSNENDNGEGTSSTSSIESTPGSCNIQFDAISKTFSHLLHIDSHKLQEIINMYKLCERPVLERFVKYQSKIDKDLVRRAGENNQSIMLASVLINNRRGRQTLKG